MSLLLLNTLGVVLSALAYIWRPGWRYAPFLLMLGVMVLCYEWAPAAQAMHAFNLRWPMDTSLTYCGLTITTSCLHALRRERYPRPLRALSAVIGIILAVGTVALFSVTPTISWNVLLMSGLMVAFWLLPQWLDARLAAQSPQPE